VVVQEGDGIGEGGVDPPLGGFPVEGEIFHRVGGSGRDLAGRGWGRGRVVSKHHVGIVSPQGFS
jgi:hypothetical protein